MILSLIFASDPNGVIGKGNQLPWHIPADMKLFKSFTLHHALIMGRKTYETHAKPLPHRLNIVLSSQNPPHPLPENVVWAKTWESALESAQEWAKRQRQSEIFIIGGGQIFSQAFSLPFPIRIYWTKILKAYDGDIRFPLHELNAFTKKRLHFLYHESYDKEPLFEFQLLEKG